MAIRGSSLRARAACVPLVTLAALSPACIFSPPHRDPVGDPVGIQATSVARALELYAYVWTNRDYDRYQQLLHDDFLYYPQSQDLHDMPWILGDSWGRTLELQIARNMFNPDFQPTDPRAGSIDSIKMDISILGQRDDPQSGGVQVLTHATAQVLYDASSGASSDVRFQFLVVPDPHQSGLWQIKEQHELPLSS